MAVIQLSAAQTALTNVLKDLSDVSSSIFIQWCQFLNDFAYRVVTDIEPERFITETNVSVVAGTSTYALPSDFKNFREFGTGLFVQNSNGDNSDSRLVMTGFGSSTRGYYINAGNIVLTPEPQKSETLVNRYIPNPPVFTALTDYFTLDKLSTGKQIIPGEYLQYVQNALVTLYQIWDEQPGAESYSDVRFVRCLDELTRNLSRAPMTYGLPDFSSMF